MNNIQSHITSLTMWAIVIIYTMSMGSLKAWCVPSLDFVISKQHNKKCRGKRSISKTQYRETGLAGGCAPVARRRHFSCCEGQKKASNDTPIGDTSDPSEKIFTSRATWCPGHGGLGDSNLDLTQNPAECSRWPD